jgi:hypothetical protein
MTRAPYIKKDFPCPLVIVHAAVSLEVLGTMELISHHQAGITNVPKKHIHNLQAPCTTQKAMRAKD